jgi:hypothetical protein
MSGRHKKTAPTDELMQCFAGSANCTRKGARLLLVAALFVATTLFAAATLLFVAFLFAVVHATLLARFLVFLLAALFVFFLAALLVVFFAASFLLVSLLHVLCSSIETEREESGECKAFSRSIYIE